VGALDAWCGVRAPRRLLGRRAAQRERGLGGMADVGDPYAEGEQAPRGSARRRDALERVGATRHDVDDFPFRLHVFDQP
jgi:hypothetical protein